MLIYSVGIEKVAIISLVEKSDAVWSACGWEIKKGEHGFCFVGYFCR